MPSLVWWWYLARGCRLRYCILVWVVCCKIFNFVLSFLALAGFVWWKDVPFRCQDVIIRLHLWAFAFYCSSRSDRPCLSGCCTGCIRTSSGNISLFGNTFQLHGGFVPAVLSAHVLDFASVERSRRKLIPTGTERLSVQTPSKLMTIVVACTSICLRCVSEEMSELSPSSGS